MRTTRFLICTVLFAFALSAQAQVAVKVDRTYGVKQRPTWAPKAPATAQYYYLPDIQTYYDVPARRYIYQKDGNWVRTSQLPATYKGYDLYKGQTVYLTDYKGNAPYNYYKKHKVKYAGKKWKANGHDNGNHYGQLKNKNKGKSYGNGRRDYDDENDLNDKKDRDHEEGKHRENDHKNGHDKGHGNGKGKK